MTRRAWGDQHAQRHVIRHQVAFNALALFLFRQLVQNRPQLPTNLPVQRLAAIFRDKYHLVFAIPLRVGQALVITFPENSPLHWLIKPPEASLLDSRNAQSLSGRTSRTGGLPFCHFSYSAPAANYSGTNCC